MMDQFIEELTECFPNESKLKLYANNFNMLKKTNPRKVLEIFLDTVEPYKERIIAKDETVMTDSSIPLNSELGLSRVWASEEATDNTKDAIWAHLNTLVMFGSTINSMPSGLMQGIESLASEYASQMNESDLQNMNPDMLMGSVQNMLSKIQKQ